MSHEETIMLSEVGLNRREQMLAELIGQMQTLHRRRRFRRRATIGGAPLVLFVAIAAIWFAALEPGSTPIGSHEPVAAFSNVRIVHVKTDPSLLERYRVTATPQATILTDDALVAALDEIDRPAGLIRIEGRAFLAAAF